MRNPKHALRALAAIVLVAGTFAVAAPAQAAPLNCNGAYVDTRGDLTVVVHSCSGTGTIQYTVDCFIGQDAIFSKKWSPPGGSYTFPFRCAFGSEGVGVTYRVIG